MDVALSQSEPSAMTVPENSVGWRPRLCSPTSYFCRKVFFHLHFYLFLVLNFLCFPWFWQTFMEWKFISQRSFQWQNVCPQVVSIKMCDHFQHQTTHILEFSQYLFDSNKNLFWKSRSLRNNYISDYPFKLRWRLIKTLMQIFMLTVGSELIFLR